MNTPTPTDTDPVETAVAQAARARRSDKWWKLGLAWGLLLCAATAAVALIMAAQATSQKQSLAAEIVEACKTDFATSQQGKTVCAKAEQIATNPAAAPEIPNPAPQPTTNPTIIHQTTPPSPAQFAAAFKTYCTQTHQCDTKPGPKGQPGPPPTSQQITTALAAFCSTRQDCQGQSVTAQMTLAAVQEICAKDACKGPAGQDATAEQISTEVTEQLAILCADGKCVGPAGPKGDPGRGTTSIECGPDNNWVVTYTDGATQTVTGPCRLPEPTPTPTPTGGTS